MAWLYLSIAGLFEVVWAVAMKYSHGFTRFWPSIVTAVGMVMSVWLLALALRRLPLGTGYAVWTGIGTVGTALVGLWLFKEDGSPDRLACIGLIVAGILGLKLVSGR